MFPAFNDATALTRNSSGDSSNPARRSGSCFEGPYDDSGQVGFSLFGVRSWVIFPALDDVQSQRFPAKKVAHLNGREILASVVFAVLRFQEFPDQIRCHLNVIEVEIWT